MGVRSGSWSGRRSMTTRVPGGRGAARGMRRVGGVGILVWKDEPAGGAFFAGRGGGGRPAPGLEAAGQVARAEPEHEPREERATPGDEPPRQPPVAHVATGGVAGAEPGG